MIFYSRLRSVEAYFRRVFEAVEGADVEIIVEGDVAYLQDVKTGGKIRVGSVKDIPLRCSFVRGYTRDSFDEFVFVAVPYLHSRVMSTVGRISRVDDALEGIWLRESFVVNVPYGAVVNVDKLRPLVENEVWEICVRSIASDVCVNSKCGLYLFGLG